MNLVFASMDFACAALYLWLAWLDPSGRALKLIVALSSAVIGLIWLSK